MSSKTVGISDMALYVPEPKMDLATILEKRSAEDPALERRLRRAIESTNQVSLRFPHVWEDPVTMAAEAGHELLHRACDNGSLPERVRFVAVGTESSVDMSKPIAAYMQGVLQRNGVALPRELSTFQVQHACAGGTIALAGVASMLHAGARGGDCGVVTCTDIARYQTPSTAEITQGAGAVAILVEENPCLLELDIASMGLASSDVDDFFRPLGSITARVKGRYSVDCYNEALDAAFLDHCARREVQPVDALNDTDFFVVHVPFHRMAVTGMTRLLENHLDQDPAAARRFLSDHYFEDGIAAIRHFGNTYSASAYVSLMYTLWERYRAEGEAIVGKTVMLASYGSGNTMTVLRCTISPGAPAVLAQWDLDKTLRAAADADYSAYQRFVRDEQQVLATGPVAAEHEVPAGRYYLAEIREDGYRQYERRSQ